MTEIETEARRLLASLRSMRASAAVAEASRLVDALERGALDHAAGSLKHIDSLLPASALAGLVRVRVRCLVGMVTVMQDNQHHRPPPDLEDTTMTIITRDLLAQAAHEGTGIEYLTPSQAWAADHLALALEHLEKPLAPHIAVLLESIEQKARRAFFDPIGRDDAEAMIQAVYDKQHPMFLRGPILETLREGFNELFPGLKPPGVDENGSPLFNLSDLTKALGADEDDLLAYAEEAGFAEELRTTPPNPLH